MGRGFVPLMGEISQFVKNTQQYLIPNQQPFLVKYLLPSFKVEPPPPLDAPQLGYKEESVPELSLQCSVQFCTIILRGVWGSICLVHLLLLILEMHMEEGEVKESPIQ